MDQNDSYNVQFLTDALNDMTEIIASFIMLGSKQGAKRIQKKFNKAVEQIQTFPYSGIKVHDDKLAKMGFRMIVVEKYLMFYKVFDNDKTVVFYHVLNGKRDYPSLMQYLSDESE
ncbi:MAG: type II toxin-antitoxin system RelE/ParE family toxin [Oscillospiraceae bacterium]|nr:type II toxin-antitoxin system RelE/ParE family toxin [Oscillospiraceae bacterium]